MALRKGVWGVNLCPADKKMVCPEDGGKLVIVNLQRTPKDFLASLRIFASCDDVMASWLHKYALQAGLNSAEQYLFELSCQIVYTM
jgi:hypothetical protein